MRADFTRMGLAMCVSFTALMTGSAWSQEKQQNTKAQSGETIASKSAVHRASAADKPSSVEHLTVHAQKGATIASSATKSNTPLIETAQSVTVVTVLSR